MASIVKRKSKYSVVYNIVDENGVKRQRWETFASQAEAKKRKAQIEYQQSTGTFIAPTAKTIRELLEEYINIYGINTWALSTYESRRASGVVWHNVLHEVWPRAIANDRDHVCHHRGLYCHHTPCHTAIQIGRPTRKAFQPPRQTPSSTVSCDITRNRKQPHHFVGTGRMVSEILFIPLQENRPFT